MQPQQLQQSDISGVVIVITVHGRVYWCEGNHSQQVEIEGQTFKSILADALDVVDCFMVFVQITGEELEDQLHSK